MQLLYIILSRLYVFVQNKTRTSKQINKQKKNPVTSLHSSFFQQIFKSTQKVNNYIIWFLSLRNLKSRRISTHTKYLNEYFLKGKEVVKCHGKGVLFCWLDLWPGCIRKRISCWRSLTFSRERTHAGILQDTLTILQGRQVILGRRKARKKWITNTFYWGSKKRIHKTPGRSKGGEKREPLEKLSKVYCLYRLEVKTVHASAETKIEEQV